MKAVPNKQLTVIIVDDEALARRGLTLRLKPIPDIEVVAEARHGRDALRLIGELKPDLVFLDIQMPGMDGFEVLRQLDPANLPAVVFVTAYDQYAINAFEANAIDYLLKPIDDSRLHQAIFRVRDHLTKKKAVQHKRSLLKLVSNLTGESVGSMQDVSSKQNQLLKAKQSAKLAIKDGGKTTWVKQFDIEWIDAAGDYMCVHAKGETYIMRRTMKQLEAELEPDILQRVHRSTIVNIHKVKEMQSHINGEYFLTLDGGNIVKLSRTYKDKLKYFS